MRGRMLVEAAATVAVISGLTACSGLPTSQPSIVPSPSAPSSAAAAASPTPRLETELNGELVTEDGLSAHIDTGLSLRVGQDSVQETPGRATLWLTAAGTLRVTNTATTLNPAATSVSFGIYGGWPTDSPVCRALDSVTPVDASVAGGRCWHRIATAALYGRLQGPPLTVGQTVSTDIGGPNWDALYVSVPAREAATLLDALAAPAAIAVLTDDIVAVRSDHRFRGACRGDDPATTRPSAAQPSSSRDPSDPDIPSQHALVGSTEPLRCSAIAVPG